MSKQKGVHIIKGTEHPEEFEQKRLDRPELREKIQEAIEKWNRWNQYGGELFTMKDTIDQILALIPDIDCNACKEKLCWYYESRIEEAKKQERKDIGEWLLNRDNMLSKDKKVCLLETLIAELVVGEALKGEK